MDQMTCPRRDELGAFGAGIQDQDTWQERSPLANGLIDLHCSYCGSLHPDKFMALIEAGAEVEPTDKNYKAYLNFEGRQTKFYYQHLSAEQRTQFVVWLNKKRIRIGYPGHFYRLPFFVQVEGK